ncbi:MAG: hypothetical protein Hyperionvirus3_142 [Hyperionvirus sp.]|uniref:Uncharacterized protein n=1 Tax=Hyperionvirus sp. TaxID=2487770 RepID=A0A3G5A6W7_9VIRU|nr:MAG: hypothetical protein Hyperionvirus3_142 [Hyperionvirus sp.]
MLSDKTMQAISYWRYAVNGKIWTSALNLIISHCAICCEIHIQKPPHKNNMSCSASLTSLEIFRRGRQGC